jgi:cell division protein FtsB
MKKRMYAIPLAFILLFLSFTIFGERGLLRIYHLDREKEEISRRVSLVKTENDQLKREIEALKSDRRYLESIARKDFGLVRKNEVIYKFPSNK